MKEASDDGAAERDRQVRLADAGRSEDQHIFRLAEKSGGCQLTRESLVDRRLKFEIEVVESSSSQDGR